MTRRVELAAGSAPAAWWKRPVTRGVMVALAVAAVVGIAVVLGTWGPSPEIRVQGYVEGEFVYVSSQLAGPLQTLDVQRGTWVKAGTPLFELDRTMEKAALDQAQAQIIFTEKDLQRQEKLALTPGAASERDLQLARSTRDQDQQRLQQAQWNYDQKAQAAPRDGLVFDTLYRQGEWVDAGHPVVVLLPPENVNVRCFVPETIVGALHPGQKVKVFVDGVAAPYEGTLRYIFPQSEYTPPVIYSEESRSKLVFMIEVDFDNATAAKLNPGQPVDVEFKE